MDCKPKELKCYCCGTSDLADPAFPYRSKEGYSTCLGEGVRLCGPCEHRRARGRRPIPRRMSDIERKHSAYYKKVIQGKLDLGIKVRVELADGFVTFEGEPVSEKLLHRLGRDTTGMAGF